MQTNSPLISVIMPTFNHGEYISMAVESVLNQTYSNFELIIIDNNSFDQTQLVLDKFKDNRIKIHKISNDGIIARSRNFGVKKALGEWIAFLDSDDTWSPLKLEKAVSAMHREYDVIYHHLAILNEDRIVGRITARKLKKPVLRDLLVNGNCIPNSSTVVRKLAILRIGGLIEDANLVGIEDYNLWLRIAKISDKFYLLDETLGTFRQHTNNMTDLETYTAPIITLKTFENYLSQSEIKKMYALHDYITAIYELRKKNVISAKTLFVSSMKKGKFSIQIKSALRLLIIFYKSFRYIFSSFF